ncbi:MAG: hypothetical protein HY301_15230 [Verrucomicrobia bacterium]|nr:hypothetical protein [Verrucomicrobiota bacterium]
MSKWLRRILLGAVVLAVGGWLTLSWLLKRWEAKPPPLPPEAAAVMALKPEPRDGRVWMGKSWLGERNGLPVVFVKGTPFEIGYTHGALTQKMIHRLEDDFVAMIHEYVPDEWKVRVLKNYICYRNRHLTDQVPLNYRQEIFGTVLGCPDQRPEEGPFYHRMLNYHAAHDISYMMIDNPLVSRAGCTAFGAWGGATRDGHLLTGRNFDWEAAECFGRDRVVVMCEPDGGIPFISLSWAGMTGVLSAMNRAGVSVTINGAPSSLPGETATPVAMVARDVMEKAHNLAEALAILRGAKVFVSSLWLVGSRVDGKFVVVEKTPEVTQVREPEGDSIICANHFQTAGLSEKKRNQDFRAESTSVAREGRLAELLKTGRGKMDAALAAAILRDRDLPGGVFAGNGHRSSLNALIATHSTVMDLSAGIFWAASPPHQLGKFVAFDVADFSRELPAATVPADAMTASGEFERARQAQKNLKEAKRALKAKDFAGALKLADEAEQLNPGFYQNASLRGRALLALGRRDEAAKALTAALAAQPAFLEEKQEIEKLLRQARGTK